jgi:hypothetical protein
VQGRPVLHRLGALEGHRGRQTEVGS